MADSHQQKMSVSMKGRLLVGGALVLALLCAANHVFELGFFGKSAKLIMLLSFVGAALTLYFNISSAFAQEGNEANAQESDGTELPRMSPGSHPAATIGLLVLMLSLPVVIWKMGWMNLEWYHLVVIELAIFVVLFRQWREHRQ